MNEIEEFLKQHMEQMVAFRRQHAPNTQLKWSCFEEIVLKFGQKYEWQERPKGFRRGIPKQCFFNSTKLVLRRPDLIYVEGFACLKSIAFPIHHAWCVRRGSNKVIDVTPANFGTYWGIPFSTDYVRERWSKQPEGASLLDDWENDFPLLRTNEQDFQKFLAEKFVL
jgi:hypothetical protein